MIASEILQLYLLVILNYTSAALSDLMGNVE